MRLDKYTFQLYIIMSISAARVSLLKSCFQSSQTSQVTGSPALALGVDARLLTGRDRTRVQSKLGQRPGSSLRVYSNCRPIYVG
jgi:hypothetical protein